MHGVEMIDLGDYVGQAHPSEPFMLKKGIVIDSKKDSYVIKWTSYDKDSKSTETYRKENIVSILSTNLKLINMKKIALD